MALSCIRSADGLVIGHGRKTSYCSTGITWSRLSANLHVRPTFPGTHRAVPCHATIPNSDRPSISGGRADPDSKLFEELAVEVQPAEIGNQTLTTAALLVSNVLGADEELPGDDVPPQHHAAFLPDSSQPAEASMPDCSHYPGYYAGRKSASELLIDEPRATGGRGAASGPAGSSDTAASGPSQRLADAGAGADSIGSADWPPNMG